MAQPLRQTELNLPDVTGIDTWEDTSILAALLAGQRRAIAAVEHAAPQIARAATALARRLSEGGRLIYAGAGTSIRIGVQDGSELPETFGLDAARISYLIAGGREAMFTTAGADEDDAAAGQRDAEICQPGDVMVAIAASGSTPYTLAAAGAAAKADTLVIAIVNNAGSPFGRLANVEILLDSGPEVIAGSTRLGAGTAQKAALNLLSTLTHIKLGAVHDGMMVNVQASNDKLKRRACGIVMRIAGAGEDAALQALATSHGEIKPAVLLCAGAKDVDAARRVLADAKGNLRLALQRLAAP